MKSERTLVALIAASSACCGAVLVSDLLDGAIWRVFLLDGIVAAWIALAVIQEMRIRHYKLIVKAQGEIIENHAKLEEQRRALAP